MFNDLLQYQFLQNAFIAACFASILSSIMGVIIIEKKLLMMSGGIAHTALGGVGLGYLFNFEPLLGACGFSLLSAIGIGAVKQKAKEETDVIIALFWSLGMALGVVFIALTPGYPPDLNSYLFGNILTVSKIDLNLMIGVTILIFAIICILFQDLKYWIFDPEFAKISGIKTNFLEYLILILCALTVVVLIKVVGIILVIALLSAPCATASKLTYRLYKRIILSVWFALFYCIGGLTISYHFDIPSGATIVTLSIITYLFVLIATKIYGLKNEHKLFKV